MTWFFIGGEDSEFSGIGTTSIDTTTTFRRASYARCSLKVSATSSSSNSQGWYCVNGFGARSSFWMTARYYCTPPSFTTMVAGSVMLSFFSGAARRLWVTFDTGSNLFWKLYKRDAAGTDTVLATSSTAVATSSLNKIDVFVNYAVAGSFQLYVGGILVLSYSGDVTTNSATTLDNFALGHMGANNNQHDMYWSEVAVADVDTRGIDGIVTLVPTGAGNSSGWTGAYTDVDETTLSADAMTSATANQLSQFTVTQQGALSGTVSIGAVCVSARTHKGSTGPQNLQLNVRTGGADFQSSTVALGGDFKAAQGIFTTNPNTGAAWAASEITAVGFNIGLKSIA